MKRWAAALAMLVLTTSVSGQQRTTPTTRLSDGFIADSVYVNEFFGFNYTVPQGMRSRQDPVVGGHRDPLGNYHLFGAFESSDAGVLKRFAVIMANSPAYPDAEGARSYVRRFAETYKDYHPESLAHRTFAGRDFFILTGRSVSGAGAVLFTTYRGYVLGFEFGAQSSQELDRLIASLDSLNFSGPDTPLPPLPPMPVERLTYVAPSWSSGLKPGTGCEGDEPTRVRLSPEVAEGMLCTDKTLCGELKPLYPPMAKAARIQGQVVLSAVIGCDGKIRELHVVSGHPMLVQGAIAAARKWTYKPYVVNGRRVEMETTVTVNFKLADNPER